MKLLSCIVDSSNRRHLFVSCKEKVVRITLNDENSAITEFTNPADAQDGYPHSIEVDFSSKTLYAVFENKNLRCWSLDTCQLLRSVVLRKKASGIAVASFSSDAHSTASSNVKNITVIGDKAGDIWGYRGGDLHGPVLLGGHTASVVTDLAINPTQTCVATSDRDEKIRISQFPYVEMIENYLLGHSNVVCSIAFTHTGNQLASVGWDHQLILWNLDDYSMLDHIAFKEVTTSPNNVIESSDGDDIVEKQYNEEEAGNYPSKIIANQHNTLAVMFKNETNISIVDIQENRLTVRKSIALSEVPIDMVFVQENVLVVLLPTPHYVKIVNIDSEKDVTSQYFNVQSLEHLKHSLGENYSMEEILGEASAENGLKKHQLDKRFNNSENINLDAKKGAKRSRKH